MAKIIKALSVIVSCGFCVGMIVCSKLGIQTGVYVCIAGCFAGFLTNMLATALKNRKLVEEQLKQKQQD